MNDLDLGTQYHLIRYSFLYERAVLGDGTALAPLNDGAYKKSKRCILLTVDVEPGLKSILESIDNRSDFKAFMQNYAFAHGGANRGPRREGPREEGYVRISLTWFIP